MGHLIFLTGILHVRNIFSEGDRSFFERLECLDTEEFEDIESGLTDDDIRS